MSLPSRLSAETPEQAQRQRFLDAVSSQGYISDYRGIRVTKFGQRFEIQDVIVWQLIDRSGVNWGQAAHFPQWRALC